MNDKSCLRSAFTVVELLVIIALLSVLIGLAVPAVQKVRESGARTEIANSLKQVALACHAANQSHGRLPPATGTYDNNLWASLSVHLLPFVEQTSVYSKVQQGAAPANVAIAAYNAPLDSSTADFVRVQNFAANVRVFDDAGYGASYDAAVRSFALTCHQDLGSSMSDGLSNTILFATRHANSSAASTQQPNCSSYDGQLINDPGNYLTISGSFPNGTFGPVNFMNFSHVVWCTGTLEGLGGLGNNPTHAQWVSQGCIECAQGYSSGSSVALAATYSPVGATYCFADISSAGAGSAPGKSGPKQVLASAPIPGGPGGGYSVGPNGNALTGGKYHSLIIFSSVNQPLLTPPGVGPGAFFGALPMSGGVSATQTTGWQLAPSPAQTDCSMAALAHSFTAAGLQVSLADGSVRTISPSISPATWNFALQPNDGNVLGANWENQ